MFMGYALFGGQLPYPFTIREVPPLVFIDHTFLTTQAIFGVPTGVSATFVYLFILLAAFLQKTGASQFIIDFSMALVGDLLVVQQKLLLLQVVSLEPFRDTR